jgi:hypothetical protein
VGSVDNYTRRVIAALCRLANRFITWPDDDRKALIKRQIGLESIFHDCIGFVDGSLIPLTDKPSMEGGDDFFSHKKRYGFNALLVCDSERTFTYAKLGPVASVHDQSVIDGSDVSDPMRLVLSYESLTSASNMRDS